MRKYFYNILAIQLLTVVLGIKGDKGIKAENIVISKLQNITEKCENEMSTYCISCRKQISQHKEWPTVL